MENDLKGNENSSSSSDSDHETSPQLKKSL